MAVTHTSLLILATLGTLSTLTLFMDLDRVTQFVVPFIGAVIWALFAMSSFRVHAQAFPEPEAVYPLVYLGVGLSVCVGMMSLYHFAKLLGEETGATNADGLLQ